jgi:hypothetical protein
MIDINYAHRVFWMHIPDVMIKVCSVAIITKLHFIILLILYDT